MRPAFILSSLLLAAFLNSTTLARQVEVIPHAQDKPPGPALSPAEAIAKMTVPEGFTVELVASEPDIVNPVAMTFDERGRAWITESLEYPRKSAGPGRDRIKVLEDTDGDGKADTFTIFADGLNIPSGIAVGHGGVWVANSPDILFLQDTDGDGKADKREVVATGFGRDDTHELPNSLTWGPDGWLYGWNGVFNQSKVTNRKGETFSFTCAIFRIHPKTRDFELFCEGTSNPWGIAINPEGDLFASACVIDHLWHLVETGYYHRQGGPYPPYTWKIESIADHKHQKAAYCGIHYFDSDAYPPEYRDKLYMGNIHGNCINVDSLKRNGSTYKAEAAPDFLSADDAWFMPVAQKTGPDGCLYILDWYDRYHCYQDANRDPAGIDRLKGRLYRVRYEDTPRRSNFDLSKESDGRLIELLSSPNVYDRDIAQRLLVERDKPENRAGLQAVVLDAKSSMKGRMHALWALVGAGPLDKGFHLALLSRPEPSLRAWGVRAAGNQGRVDRAVLDKVASLVSDPDRSVILQVVIATPKLAVDPFQGLAQALAGGGGDPVLARVVWLALHPLLEDRAGDFLRLVEKADLDSNRDLAALLPRAVDRLLGRRKPGPAHVATLVRLAASTSPEIAGRCLAAVTAQVQAGTVGEDQSKELRKALEPMLLNAMHGRPDGPLAPEALLLLTTWKDPRGLGVSRGAVLSAALPDAMRLRALDAIAFADGRFALDVVTRAIDDPKTGSVELRSRMLDALGRLDDPKVADELLRRYPTMPPAFKARAVELLTGRPAWGKALVSAVESKGVPTDALDANQLRKLLQTGDPDLVRRVKATWGTVREGRDPKRELVVNRMRTFLRSTPGDPFAGQKVFAKLCAQCHKLYGEGQEVGPDISGVGRGDFEQLLSNVFDPSLVIGSSYQATTVAAKDGRVLTGLLAEDGKERIVLKIQGGKQEIIPRSEIEEIKTGSLSLMPEEIETQLTRDEWADLFAYLALDKPPSDPSAKRLPGTPEPRKAGR